MPKAGVPTGHCQVCKHPDRVRFEYLACLGEPLLRLAEQFGVSKDSAYRHYDNHVSAAAKRAAKIGPFQTEEQLRRLCAENDKSVLENLRAIYQGLARIWLQAIEAGAVDRVTASREMRENLKLTARITREILPSNGPVIFNTVVQNGNFRSAMLELAEQHPEVRPRVAQIVKLMVEEEAKLLDVTPALEAAHAA
jgi:hypothetical protein